MAELVDALALGASAFGVGVRLPSLAPEKESDEDQEEKFRVSFLLLNFIFFLPHRSFWGQTKQFAKKEGYKCRSALKK